jgi:hypothetical protein
MNVNHILSVFMIVVNHVGFIVIKTKSQVLEILHTLRPGVNIL